MKRRGFLFRSGVSLGASALIPVLFDGSRSILSQRGYESVGLYDSWENIRSQFLLSGDRIHMAQMLLATNPILVRDAIQRHREALDRDPVNYYETNITKFDNAVRDAAAAYIGAESGEIALTDSTTMGLSILYRGLRLNKGDEILTTTHDHYSTEKSLAFASARSGARIKRVSLYENPSQARSSDMVEILKKNISTHTRLIAITHVHSATGVKTPIAEIGKMLRDVNASRAGKQRIYYSIDGVHGFGVENMTMDKIGCDYFSAGTHKWMFGPRGTGILFARKDAWDMVDPVIPPFEDSPYLQWMEYLPITPLSFAERCTPGGFHSFENRWALSEAFTFMTSVGKQRVEERTHALSKLLKEGLSSIPHVTLVTPMQEDISAGINSFDVRGMHSLEVVEKLGKQNITASAAPYKVTHARMTPCILNTEDEVYRCIRAVETILESK